MKRGGDVSMLINYTVCEITCNNSNHCFIGFTIDLETWRTRHRSGIVGFTRRHGIKDCKAVSIHPNAIEAEQARDVLIKVRQDEGWTVNVDTYTPIYHLCEIECETPNHYYLGYTEHFESWLERHKDRNIVCPFTSTHGVRSGRIIGSFGDLTELKKAQAAHIKDLLEKGMTVNGREPESLKKPARRPRLVFSK
jgi:predicted GIY-YIG superfamily endonuclease